MHHRPRLVLAPGLVLTCLLGSAATLPAGDSVRRYGSATPGSGNIAPTIWVNGVPRPGDAGFELRIERALGGTWAFPFLSTTPADSTYGGVRFLVDPASAVYGGAYFLPGQGDGGGAGDVPLALPRNVGLIGQALYIQAFTLDDFAPNPLGFGATTGLRLVPALPGALLAARAVSGAPDAQEVIELQANRVVTLDATRVSEGRSAAFVAAGGVALVLDPVAATMQAFDASVSPPSWLTSIDLGQQGVAVQIAATPDGSRAYVVHQGPAGTRPPIVAYDVRAGAGFGQPWPGAPIRLTGIGDAHAMVFKSDSEVAFVAASDSVSQVDVRPTSATFHQQVARLVFSGREVRDIALAPDDGMLFALLTAPGLPGELAVIDAATFVVVDQDPTAPGVQNLGGEVSFPRTPVPDVLGRIAVDPRGDDVYCTTVGAIVRLTVAPTAATFRRVTSIGDNIPAAEPVAALVVSDAGERLYAATSVQVIEIDTETLLSPRGWPVRGAVSLAFR